MKFLPQHTRVWALLGTDFALNSNTSGDGQFRMPHEWSSLKRHLIVDFVLQPKSMEEWQNKEWKGIMGDAPYQYFFYRFLEPLDGYIGFVAKYEDVVTK